MLAQARIRLERFGSRARFRECLFDAPFPECDAIAASLGLHHVPTMAEKSQLFERIHQALRPGGVFVNADVTISADPAEGEQKLQAMGRSHGCSAASTRRRAYQHFDEWAEEDTYFPIEDELAAMHQAGLHAECVWQCRPNTLLVGRKD